MTQHHTHTQAILSETAFIRWATLHDYPVARPIFHAYPYDFLAYFADPQPESGVYQRSKWHTVQVKTASWDSKRIRAIVKLTNSKTRQGCRKEYHDGDFDYLFVVYREHTWLFPWDQIKGKTKLTFAPHLDPPLTPTPQGPGQERI